MQLHRCQSNTAALREGVHQKLADLQALTESIPATTRWSHGSHELHVLDLFSLTPLPVIPALTASS